MDHSTDGKHGVLRVEFALFFIYVYSSRLAKSMRHFKINSGRPRELRFF
jgi:hypothetical protein